MWPPNIVVTHQNIDVVMNIEYTYFIDWLLYQEMDGPWKTQIQGPLACFLRILYSGPKTFLKGSYAWYHSKCVLQLKSPS